MKILTMYMIYGEALSRGNVKTSTNLQIKKIDLLVHYVTYNIVMQQNVITTHFSVPWNIIGIGLHILLKGVQYSNKHITGRRLFQNKVAYSCASRKTFQTEP